MTSFAAQKAAWLERIARDQAVTHLAFRLAYFIGLYLNRISGDAWPSQDLLAHELGVTRRGVQLALDTLVAGGHLVVERARGRGHTNRYRPVLESGNANAHSPIDDTKGEAQFANSTTKMRTGEQEKANNRAIKCERPFAQTFSKRTLSKKNLEGETPAREQIGAKGKTRIPPDFAITPEHFAYAKSKGFDQAKATDMFAAFKNNHAARGSEFASWDAAWCVWVDNEHKFRKADDPYTNFL
jgi:hypothetical protein